MEKIVLKHTFEFIGGLFYKDQYSPYTKFMDCNLNIMLRLSNTPQRYLEIYFNVSINPNYFMYFSNIEYKLHSENKEALVYKCDQLFFFKSNSMGYPNFILWEDLLDEKNGYINNTDLYNNSITVEIQFDAKSIKDEDDMILFLQSIRKEITDSHLLEIKKQNEKIFDLEKYRDAANLIIDLVAQGKHMKTEETETFNELIEKYEYLKQAFNKIKGNDNSTVDKNISKLENISDKIAIYLAKLKIQNEDLKEKIKQTENSKQHLETRVKTIETNEKEAEEMRQDIIIKLDEERKKNAQNKIEINKLQYHLQNVDIEFESDLHNKEKQLKTVKDDIESIKNNLEFEKKGHKENEFKLRNVITELNKLKFDLENKEKQYITTHSDSEKRQIEEYQKELKDLKAELLKAREEINKERLEKEKTQQEYEDISNSLELLRQENKTLKTLKLRNVDKATASSFCEINKEDSVSIISTENDFEDDLNTQ